MRKHNSIASQSEAQHTQKGEKGVTVRVALVVALSMTLVGAMRWAMNVTNANARQVSHSISQLRNGFDTQSERQAGEGEILDMPPKVKKKAARIGQLEP